MDRRPRRQPAHLPHREQRVERLCVQARPLLVVHHPVARLEIIRELFRIRDLVVRLAVDLLDILVRQRRVIGRDALTQLEGGLVVFADVGAGGPDKVRRVQDARFHPANVRA